MTSCAVLRRLHSLAVYADFIDFAVTIHAPPHRQGFDLAHDFHGSHIAVALLAIHAGIDVGAVIEINEVGNIVDLDPFYGLGLFSGIRFALRIQSERVVDFGDFG